MSKYKTKLLIFLFKSFACLPLPVIHFIGSLLGIVIYKLFKKPARVLRNNLRMSGIWGNSVEYRKILKNNIKESGKAILETFAVWFKSEKKLLRLVKQVDGWEAVLAALKRGKGVIFLTPHLGCFEITSLYYGSRHPFTVLYRAPKQHWLHPIVLVGRQRTNITLAPANSHGVKQLLQALKRGEAIGILPDQIPAEGEGEWAPLLGRPAYTMTLASKLANKTDAAVFMAFGERLSGGQGYHIHITALEHGAIATPDLLNNEIEKQIKQCPAQYLWSYPRHKVRRASRHKLISPIPKS